MDFNPTLIWTGLIGLIAGLVLIVAGSKLLGRARPALRIIEFNRDVNARKRRRFEPIDASAAALGFYRTLDFRMREFPAWSYGRIYQQNQTMTVLAARLAEGPFGPRRIYELYSTFSNKDRLVTTNLSVIPARLNAPFIVAQQVPPDASLAEAYAEHLARLHREVSRERTLVYDKQQKLFALIQGV